jgi:hypothetical protein
MTTLQDRPRTRGITLLSTLFLFVSASFAAACGGPVRALCEAECDCEACSDDAYDACVDNGKRIEEDSEEAGCRAEFEAYSECAETNYACNSGTFDVNGCFSEQSTLTMCVKGPGF